MAQQVDGQFARHFLQRLYAAVNAHDASAVAALCSEGVIWKDPAAPQARDATSLAVRSRITGTMTEPLTPPGFASTGGAIEFETAEFSEFDGDSLARLTSEACVPISTTPPILNDPRIFQKSSETLEI